MAKQTSILSVAFSLTLAALSGCDAEPATTIEFRSSPWSEVVCTLGSTDRCYAKTAESPELLHPVLSQCDLQELVDVGDLVPTTDGWFYTCDFGGRPESFADVLCFYDSFTSVVCYGGSGGWYVKVEPTCAPDTFTAKAWPSGSCDADGSVGPTDYDAVFVDPLGPKWLGLARNGQDRFTVVPSCHVPVGSMNMAANPFWCLGDPGSDTTDTTGYSW